MDEVRHFSKGSVSLDVSNNHRKALGFILFLDEFEKGLGDRFLKSLPSDKMSSLSSMVEDRPCFSEDQIQSLIEDSYRVLIEKKDMMVRPEFIDSIDSESENRVRFKEDILLNKKSLLRVFPTSFFQELADEKSYLALALLCKLATKEDVIALLRLFSIEVSEQILFFYVKINTSSVLLLDEFTSFMLDRFDEEEERLDDGDSNFELAQILEQSSPALVKRFKQLAVDIDWKDVESKMFKLSDLKHLDSAQLNRVLDVFVDAKELAVLLSQVPKNVLSQLQLKLTDRILGMVAEEGAYVQGLDKAAKQAVISKFISVVRDIKTLEDPS
ncbi:MAG: hypothetical protein VW378_00160 [bacterium]